jgi:hypothetical protein
MLGLQEEECQPKLSAALPRGNGSKLGNTDVAGSQRSDQLGESALSPESSSTMGDADSEGQQQSERNLGESGGWAHNPGENVDHSTCGCDGSKDSICARGNGTSCSGPPMDHSIDARLERHFWDGNAKVRWQESVRSIASTSVWPAGQGREQYGWEEPRLESRVGLTIDGVDFTEDLLRMAGNGVVPQQSAIAFLTLIKNFL